MATAVAKGAYYTWDTANFTWDAAQAVHVWDDMAPLFYTRDDAETFFLRDGMTSAAGKVARDAVRLADTRRWADLLGTKREQVGVHETYWDYISYVLTILESARVIESSYRGMDVPKREGVKITRRSHSEIMKSPREQLGILDASLRAAAFKRTWSESASLGDDEDNHVTADKFETIRTSEHRAADVYKPTAEQIGTTERQYHRAQTFRTFMEKASLYEHMRRDLGGGYSEAVAVDDRFLRALDGIIEEVAVRKGGMTADEFQQLVNQPMGYERFIPYIVGEYEYQKALVRLAVTPGSFGAEPAVYNVVVHVDIDDTVDRGTTVITDTTAPTTVHFSKHYYTKPEVTVTLHGGNTSDGVITPNVVEIDKDADGYYFKVELLKQDGTRAAGSITWQSVGY
ncbi:hypothetical protein [Mitsuokella jalaludinii]|uniref:hypothetical protein n=1 Tax=Mitsuokella jalaludinii TaxID=187979 RepID=UPI00204E927F|nr:MAG TPA: hypothetical protein [Caudoviricetes sp.]